MFRSISAYLLARCYDLAMQRSERLCLYAWRSELLAKVQGQVLEIGAGTGLNLQHYPPQCEPILSEPDRQMRRALQQRLTKTRYAHLQLTDWRASAIDLPDNSLDCIVSTLVLCSVDDQQASLAELYRLLRPGGALLFLEHVVALKPSTIGWQQRFEPLWSCCCGNCHLTRDTGLAIKTAGFLLESCQEDRLLGAPAIVRRSIRGVARKPATDSDITSHRNQDFDPASYPDCPYCRSRKIAKFVYGKPALTRQILLGLESGEILSGGCMADKEAPQWHCQKCQKDFGQMPNLGATT